MNIFCSVIGHTRDRRRVRRAGDAVVSVCKRCHTPMARPTIEAEWRPYDPAVERFTTANATAPMVGLWDLPKV